MSAAPAEPVLASTLWNAFGATKSADSSGSRLPSHCKLIDKALSGGIDYGNNGLTCISSSPDSDDSKNLAHAFLISHLVSHEDARATVVDTALGFDVLRFHQRITNALLRKDGQDVKNVAEAAAVEMLGRVKIMKVFDFVGLTEAIAELRADLDGARNGATVSPEQAHFPRGTVGDSDGEEDLLDQPLSPTRNVRIEPSHQNSAPPPLHKVASRTGPIMLLIDDLFTPSAPLLKNNYTQAQALLASFMRSLRHLTRTHSTCTLLLNNAISFNASNSNANAPKDEPPSVFSSCLLRPTLGNAFRWQLDLHLMVHRIPKREVDARVLHGSSKGGVVEKISVMEVLSDVVDGWEATRGCRYQRWALFGVDGNGDVVDVI